MNYLVEAILHHNDRIPGMAFKSRCLDGRVKRPLRALLGFCGTTFVAGGMAIGRVAVRAYQDGSVGFVLLLLLGSAGVMVLIGGLACTPSASEIPRLRRSRTT
jgi:hypothetical protein